MSISTSSNITLSLIQPSDYLPVVHLQSAAFAHEQFGVVAFGPLRNSEAAYAAGAASLARAPKPGDTSWNVKAVNGEGEIVGFASWVFCVGRNGSEEEKKRLGTRESWAAQEDDAKDEGKQKENPFGPSANVAFCEEIFGKGDEMMARSTEGRDYAKLSILVVSPTCQRQGIGSMLLEYGLREANALGIQAVLGASQFGIGLYRKYGFVEFDVVEIKLWKYEGGEGMGLETHVIMHRPVMDKLKV